MVLNNNITIMTTPVCW